MTDERICDICGATTLIRLLYGQRDEPVEERIISGCIHAVESGDPQVPITFDEEAEIARLQRAMRATDHLATIDEFKDAA